MATGSALQDEPALSEVLLTMKKIEAVIKPYALDDVKSALNELGLVGMTVIEVRGYRPMPSSQRPASFIGDYQVGPEFVPGLKVEVVVPDQLCDSAVEAILHTGKFDGFAVARLVVQAVDDVIRIRTEERLDRAV